MSQKLVWRHQKAGKVYPNIKEKKKELNRHFITNEVKWKQMVT